MKSLGMVLMVMAIILALVACVYVPWKIVQPVGEGLYAGDYKGFFCLWNLPETEIHQDAKIDVTIVVLELLATAIIGCSGCLLYRKGSKKA